jgi:hypothetical protein
VKAHLDELVVDKAFRHQTSQKEEHVDKEYREEWFDIHKWRSHSSTT